MKGIRVNDDHIAGCVANGVITGPLVLLAAENPSYRSHTMSDLADVPKMSGQTTGMLPFRWPHGPAI